MACLVCRSRKIRCDQARPGCRNCERVGVQCPGYKTQSESISTKERNRSVEAIYQASGVEKRRVGACDACRLSKSRCTKTRPLCRRCLVRNIDCVYSKKIGLIDVSNGSRSSAESPVQSVASPKMEVNQWSVLAGNPALQSQLFNAFFERVHPLRCLSFLHKPSFFYSLDRGTLVQDYDEPLLLIMSALGARYLVADSIHNQSDNLLINNESLAEAARLKVLAHLHEPTIYHIMAMILLCDFSPRTGQTAMAFVLTGCIFRQVRLLDLDAPNDETGGSLVESKSEMKNRLVWASYSLDVLFGSGVDKNSSWRDDFPRIPLPCSDTDFLLQAPTNSVTLLDVIKNPQAIQQLDPPALSVVLFYLRTKVLRYIRTMDEESHVWNLNSPFMAILQQLENFYHNMPRKYNLTEVNMYMLKDQRTLGAVFALHLLYHAAVCDLTRISLPGFNFPLASAFHNAPSEFVVQCQRRCRQNAERISDLMRKGQPHFETAFDDPSAAVAAFESAKIQIVYYATVPDDSLAVGTTKDNIKSNLDILNMLSLGQSEPSPYIRALVPLCVAFGMSDVVGGLEGQQQLVTNVPAEITGPASLHHLSKMAPFRRATSETRSQLRATKSHKSRSEMDAGSTLQGTDQGITLALHPGSVVEESSHPPQPAPGFPSFDLPDTGIPEPGTEQVSAPHGHFMLSSMQESIRAAEEMSDFLTWDTAEWWNFNAGT